jgi:hypothetical protein
MTTAQENCEKHAAQRSVPVASERKTLKDKDIAIVGARRR